MKTSLREVGGARPPREAEEELREQNEQVQIEAERKWYQQLFDLAPDPYIVTDPAGTIREANLAAAIRISKNNPDFLKGKPLITFVAKNDWDRFQDALRLAKGETVRDFVAAIQPREGEPFEAALTVGILRSASGQPLDLLWLVRDVTASRRTLKGAPTKCEFEDRVRERTIEADRKKDEFISVLAHELRTLLSSGLTALEVIRRHGANAEARERAEAILSRQLHHMSRLVDDLLDVSRISRGKLRLQKQPVDFAAVVEEAIEDVRPVIDSRRQDLRVSLPPNPVPLQADPTRLEQVVSNLIHNAVKYTDLGGCIWLTLEVEGTTAMLRVRDTGVGIPPDMLPHVFEPFVQQESSPQRAQGGLGIGLMLVKQLVEMQGGTVEAQSAGMGQGSEFIISFPVLPQSSS